MIQGRGEEDTPFTFENFKFAFGQVYKDMFKLGGKPTKCSLLNEYFGMNDMDMNTYADKIKSDRYGIFNISNILSIVQVDPTSSTECLYLLHK
jgi:hypothetical protein